MLFDQRAMELPTATLRSASWSTRLVGDLRRWFVSQWQWLRPRTLPVAVALAGMIALLGAARYLTALATEMPERLVAHPVESSGPVDAARPLHDEVPGGLYLETSRTSDPTTIRFTLVPTE